MEGGGFSPYSNLGNFTETAMDLDFMDELLFDGCWIETTDGNNFKQSIPSTSTSTAANDLSFFNPSQNSRTAHLGMSPLHNIPEEEPYRKRFLPSPPHMKIEELVETHPTSREVQESSITSVQSGKFFVQGTELGKRLWIPPNVSSGFSVKDRLVQAIGYLQDVLQDKDFLIQIWVPVEKGGKKFLTTKKQPYIFNPDFVSLERYRLVSENYSFPADEDSRESVGMPGRVFLGKLPEWTPDVQFFRSEEYPRIKFAQEYDVRGSLALPVFERASGTCLGVVEIVTTTQRINYRPELENICKALEAVDLSSNNLSPPSIKFPQVCNKPYEAALREISELLTCICRSHGLPLALTWAPCVQQGKFGSRHSDENYSRCVSTIDSVCFVPDADSQNFLEACSEHHLLQGEGIVGRAFKTKKRCFATDVTAFSKLNYPLVHHAKIFGLHAALAIPLSNSYTGSVELVLELFFPRGCIDTEGQKQMLNSLSAAMQQEFRSLYLVMDKEIEEEVILPVRETTVFANQSLGEEENKRKSSALEEVSPEESLWIAHMMEANKKGKGVSLSWEYQKEEPKEEFKLMTHWDRNQHDPEQRHVVTEHRQYQQNPEPKISFDGSGESFSSAFHSTLGNRRPGERRRTKTEKSIGLEVLRQYFAGSLKDAAKSIGVCPTTLKRICRQHGITRWPSRKIKKVGHSLRKLQLVIDSVQGVEGSIQLGSFYTSFPELSSPNFSAGSGPSKTNDNLNQSSMQTENGLFPSGGSTAPKSPSSSCSQSSGSSTCCSTGANKSANTRNGSIGINPKEAAKTSGTILKRIRSDAELHIVNQEKPKVLARTQSHKTFPERPNLETQPQFPVPSSSRNLKSLGAIKVKALFGESKVRLSLQANWGYRDLQQEIGRRFYIEDISRFDLKYLDDDREWVLLTCDDDLEECIDIYRAYPNRTIKIAVQQASQHKLGSSLGSTGPS